MVSAMPRTHERTAAGPWGLLLLIAFSLLVCGSAGAKEVETLAEGTGADQTRALADALGRAVAQVNGVRSALSVSTGAVELSTRSSETSGSGTTSKEGNAQLGLTPDATMRAQGTVSRYEILATDTLEDGSVRVSVRAFVTRVEAPSYKAPGSNVSRKRVAVFPVSSNRASYDFFGLTMGEEMSSELATHLETTLLGSGEVSLLDRRSLGASLVELGLVGSTLSSDQEKAKLKALRGADLILLATINEARHEEFELRVKSTGQRRTSADTSLQVDLRAVVPATGELLLSRSVAVDYAASRQHGLVQVAEVAAFEVVRLLTGKSLPLPVHGPADPGQYEAPESTGPRRSGVRLPNER